MITANIKGIGKCEFFTRLAGIGIIRIKCKYWDMKCGRSFDGWVSGDKQWKPMPALIKKLEAIYKSYRKPKTK
jgi:hypothetical protein